MTIFLLAGSLLLALGRFTVPGHPLTGWPGLYEMIAHAWVGILFLKIAEGIDWRSLWAFLRSLMMPVYAAAVHIVAGPLFTKEPEWPDWLALARFWESVKAAFRSFALRLLATLTILETIMFFIDGAMR